ncbi:MAG: hypothetical protein M1830_003890 [Pleopsidium flavum]|nr:MAG: hypothetical protein M1830_003890 [Pleopsidium flavum]
MTGAVSRDGDLYVWGGRSGSSSGSGEGRISCLPSAEDEVALVDIEGGVDVVDVGVGAGHILALTGDGRVFAVGLNRNGQLGIGEESGFCEDWVEVPLEFGERKKVVGVECGYWSSFVLVRVV